MREEPRPLVLRLPGVLAATGLSQSGVYEQIAAGTFPAPIRLGPRAVGWVTAEVDAWRAQRIAERDAGRGTQAEGDYRRLKRQGPKDRRPTARNL